MSKESIGAWKWTPPKSTRRVKKKVMDAEYDLRPIVARVISIEDQCVAIERAEQRDAMIERILKGGGLYGEEKGKYRRICRPRKPLTRITSG